MRIKNYDDLISHGNIAGRKIAAQIMQAALEAGNPYNNTLKLVSIKDNKLIFDNKDMESQGDPRSGPEIFDLKETDRIFIFAVGKGILYIVKALEEVLGDNLTGGIAIGKHGDEKITERVKVILGGHPVPDEDGIDGCRQILQMAASLKLTERDLVITAMGNGCSALAAYPDEGISIEDVKFLNQFGLIDNGMTTEAMSYLRNQIDLFRGGRVLKAMRPAKMINLIGVAPGTAVTQMSPGAPQYKTEYESFLRNNLWLPNMPDCTNTKRAIKIANEYGVFEGLPRSIRNKLLSNPEESSTLSYEEYESYNCRLFGVMPKHMNAYSAAMAKAEELGYKAFTLTDRTKCEAGPAGQYVASLAKYNDRTKEVFKAPCALFQTGELIATIRNEVGIGGTNQEYCVAAATVLDGNKNIVMAGIDTDGTDGPGGDFHPDATAKGINCLTGGIVDGYTAAEAREKGIDLLTAIRTHGTSRPLWELKSGIAAVQNIGVGDMQVAIIMEEEN